MPIYMECPGCPTEHELLDALQGQRVRCKECDEVFVVRGPRRGKEEDGEIVAGSKAAAKIAGRRKRFEEEIAERSSQAGPSTGEVLGALAASVVFLVILGALAIVFLTQKKSPGPNPQPGGGQQQIAQANPRPQQPVVPQRPVGPDLTVPPPVDRKPLQLPPVRKPRDRWRPRQNGTPLQPPQLWEVKPDPAREKVELQANQAVSIAIPGGDDVLYPSTPSKFVAVGRNFFNTDVREVWNWETGKRVGALKGNVGLADPVALSPDGQHLAGVCAAQRGSIDVYTVDEGKLVRQIPVSENLVFFDRIDFAGPGRLLTVHNAGIQGMSIDVWEISSGRRVQHVTGPQFADAKHAALSPGGTYLALPTLDRKLQIFDLSSGKLAARGMLPQGNLEFMSCQGLAFSPEGTELASLFRARGKSRLLTWDVAAGKVVADLPFAKDLSFEVKFALGYKGRCLECLPGRSGWLVFGQLVVGRDGKSLGTIPVESHELVSGPRKVVSKDQVLVVTGDRRSRSVVNLRLPGSK